MPKTSLRCHGKVLGFMCLWMAASWFSNFTPALQFNFPGLPGSNPTEETSDKNNDNAVSYQQEHSQYYTGSDSQPAEEESDDRNGMMAMGVGALAATAVAGAAFQISKGGGFPGQPAMGGAAHVGQPTMGGPMPMTGAAPMPPMPMAPGMGMPPMPGMPPMGMPGMPGMGNPMAGMGNPLGMPLQTLLNNPMALFQKPMAAMTRHDHAKTFSDRIEDALEEAGEDMADGEMEHTGKFYESPGMTLMRETRNAACDEAVSDNWNIEKKINRVFENPYQKRMRLEMEEENKVLCDGYVGDRMKEGALDMIICNGPEVAATVATGAAIMEAKRLRLVKSIEEHFNGDEGGEPKVD